MIERTKFTLTNVPKQIVELGNMAMKPKDKCTCKLQPNSLSSSKKKKKDCTSIFVVLHFKWAGGLKNQKAKQLSPYKAELYRLAPQTYC